MIYLNSKQECKIQKNLIVGYYFDQFILVYLFIYPFYLPSEQQLEWEEMEPHANDIGYCMMHTNEVDSNKMCSDTILSDNSSRK